MAAAGANGLGTDKQLLIVDDDKPFLERLARAMEGRGFTVTTAESVADGLSQLEIASPAFAVVDMRLEDGNGLDVISALKRRRPDARAIILTGYGNIATAVNAVKLGAVDYLIWTTSEQALREFWPLIAQTGNFNKAFTTAFGMSPSDFYSGFAAYRQGGYR